MTELEKIIERFDRGYTATLYGTVDLANFQKEYDFMELVQIVKKLTIPAVVVPKGTLSNLDEAIKKAKSNMDKIKDVDKHLDDIRN